MTLQRDWAKTQVRMPPNLHPQIKKFAKDNNLSMNSAIIQLIEKGLNPPQVATISTEIEIPLPEIKAVIKVLSQVVDSEENKFSDI